MSNIQLLAAPAGRILIAAMFVISGFGKITNYGGTTGYMEAMGVPGIVLPLVILLEVGGGLAIIAGWNTRLVAFAMAGFSIVTALVFHSDFAVQEQMINFMKNMSIAGGFLFLVANGAGAYSLDNRTASMAPA